MYPNEKEQDIWRCRITKSFAPIALVFFCKFAASQLSYKDKIQNLKLIFKKPTVYCFHYVYLRLFAIICKEF